VLFRSFRILFCGEGRSGEICEEYILFSRELVNVHLGRRTVLPSELENKLVDYCIIMDQYIGQRRQVIKSFSVGNKKWFETSI
jgi:hypothetical protein